MLSINTNLSSLIAQSSMKTSTQLLNQAIERMSTGYKINHAKDNAANYSISTNMQTQISSYDIAADNVAMGMDLVTTASDTISLMQNKAERLRALCTQARNGTYGASSMNAINSEASAIMAEINRLYSTAKYNGIDLFNRKSYELSPEHQALTETVCAKAEYNGFISNPVTYTDAEVAAMTPLTDAVITLDPSVKYSISSVDELVNLAELVNSGVDTSAVEFVLGADIDLSSISNWTPIKAFNGIFDGNGHTISNLSILANSNYNGLFYSINYASSEVKNVALKDVDINIEGDYSEIGGIAGSASRGKIENCYVTGSVNGYQRVGLLAGSVKNASVINCYSDGSVSGYSRVGGLTGQISYGEIRSSYSTASIQGIEDLGGCVGKITQTAPVEDCYSTGSVKGRTNIASFCSNSVSDSCFGTGYVNAKLAIQVADVSKLTMKNVATTLQVGIYSDSSNQILFNSNYQYDLSAVRGNIASDMSLEQIEDFIKTLSEKSTNLGAVQNRLESAMDSISVNIENLTSSLSTIRDADIAEVSSDYIRQQILQQASATLLSTANQSPAIALQLI